MINTPPIPERDLLASVVERVQLRGWLCHHILDTSHHAKIIGPGFPDLVIAAPPYLFLWELKSERGKISPNQRLWMKTLAQCRTIATGIVRPSDLDRLEEWLAT